MAIERIGSWGSSVTVLLDSWYTKGKCEGWVLGCPGGGYMALGPDFLPLRTKPFKYRRVAWLAVERAYAKRQVHIPPGEAQSSV